MRPRLARGGLALLMLLSVGDAYAGPPAQAYKIVANKANPVSSLTRKQVSALFLKRVGEWPHGETALPVDQFAGAPVRDAFAREIHGRSAAAVKSYWQEVIFSGRGLPPPEKPGDREVLSYVEAHPGAIGYVSATAPILDGVKVLAVEP